MSIRAAVSNTIHTASPRRNTAAPTGVLHWKVNTVLSALDSALTGTTASVVVGLAASPPCGALPGA